MPEMMEKMVKLTIDGLTTAMNNIQDECEKRLLKSAIKKIEMGDRISTVLTDVIALSHMSADKLLLLGDVTSKAYGMEIAYHHMHEYSVTDRMEWIKCTHSNQDVTKQK